MKESSEINDTVFVVGLLTFRGSKLLFRHLPASHGGTSESDDLAMHISSQSEESDWLIHTLVLVAHYY